MPGRGLEAMNRGNDVIGNIISSSAGPLGNVKLTVQRFLPRPWAEFFLVPPSSCVSVGSGGQVSGVVFTLGRRR